jgi:hypothetical protein
MRLEPPAGDEASGDVWVIMTVASHYRFANAASSLQAGQRTRFALPKPG